MSWDKMKLNQSERKMNTTETVLTGASFVGSCLQLWFGSLLHSASSRNEDEHCYQHKMLLVQQQGYGDMESSPCDAGGDLKMPRELSLL